ncbi:MAG: methyl-accepting chemotaxis protein [Leptospirillia bacterium]
MNWVNNMNVGRKIALGFGSVALIMLIMVVVARSQVQNTQAVDDRVINLRQPTVLASTNLLNGVNQSLAGLRGYMILGKGKFKAERQGGWDLMNGAIAEMDEFSKNWTNPANVERLANIKQSMKVFAQAQQEIEDIAATPANTPATQLLVTEAAPRASVMVAEITNMINIEGKRAATPERKALLGMMADVRGTTGMALANIRAFLLTGDPEFEQSFNTFWSKNEKRFGDLSNNTGLLNKAQRASFDKFRTARDEFKGLPPKMFKIRNSPQWNLANNWLGTKAAPEAGKIKGWLNEMIENQKGLAATDIKAAHEAASNLQVFLMVLGVISIALAMVIAWGITRMITRPVSLAAEGVRVIASGDLSQRWEVTSRDELGQMLMAMNDMADSLSNIVTSVRTSSESITGGAKEIAAGNVDLSQRTEEQAASLEETASSMEEMTANVKQSADNADKANQLAVGAREQAEKGGEVVQRAVVAMSDIDESSKKIADIIGMINEIAFQTNLLALNAAVEAARAGEQGRGFAVVAQEVRNLAQRSATAADEIKGLINDSVEKVQGGTKLVEETGLALAGIQESVARVTDIVSEINAASQEQAQGIDQVNRAIMQMDEVTQQNAALVEEAAATSDNMAGEAQDLVQQMTFFTTADSPAGGPLKVSAPEPVSQEASTNRGGFMSKVSEPVSSRPAAQPTPVGSSHMDDMEDF